MVTRSTNVQCHAEGDLRGFDCGSWQRWGDGASTINWGQPDVLGRIRNCWRLGRNAVAPFGLALLMLLILGCQWAHPTNPIIAGVVGNFAEVTYLPLYRALRVIFTPTFAIIMVVTLVLERLVPAQPNRKLLSVSTAQDFVWFFYEGVLDALIVTTYVAALSWSYSRVAPASPALNIAALPDALRFGIALLVVDLCYYLQHRCNHSIPWFWQLHTVHHSQKQLNFFTDFRYHGLEYVVRQTFLAVPFIVLQLTILEIVYISVFLRWYTRFYHANIRTDLWLLRYVLVTPQSHRIHHSIEERHQNKNFGSLFSIWDFIFGTQYRKWDEFPETGIHDIAFPHETRGDIASLLLTPWKQMIYPLRQIGRSANAWRFVLAGPPKPEVGDAAQRPRRETAQRLSFNRTHFRRRLVRAQRASRGETRIEKAPH